MMTASLSWGKCSAVLLLGTVAVSNLQQCLVHGAGGGEFIDAASEPHEGAVVTYMQDEGESVGNETLSRYPERSTEHHSAAPISEHGTNTGSVRTNTRLRNSLWKNQPRRSAAWAFYFALAAIGSLGLLLFPGVRESVSKAVLPPKGAPQGTPQRFLTKVAHSRGTQRQQSVLPPYANQIIIGALIAAGLALSIYMTALSEVPEKTSAPVSASDALAAGVGDQQPCRACKRTGQTVPWAQPPHATVTPIEENTPFVPLTGEHAGNAQQGQKPMAQPHRPVSGTDGLDVPADKGGSPATPEHDQCGLPRSVVNDAYAGEQQPARLSTPYGTAHRLVKGQDGGSTNATLKWATQGGFQSEYGQIFSPLVNRYTTVGDRGTRVLNLAALGQDLGMLAVAVVLNRWVRHFMREERQNERPGERTPASENVAFRTGRFRGEESRHGPLETIPWESETEEDSAEESAPEVETVASMTDDEGGEADGSPVVSQAADEGPPDDSARVSDTEGHSAEGPTPAVETVASMTDDEGGEADGSPLVSQPADEGPVDDSDRLSDTEGHSAEGPTPAVEAVGSMTDDEGGEADGSPLVSQPADEGPIDDSDRVSDTEGDDAEGPAPAVETVDSMTDDEGGEADGSPVVSQPADEGPIDDSDRVSDTEGDDAEWPAPPVETVASMTDDEGGESDGSSPLSQPADEGPIDD